MKNNILFLVGTLLFVDDGTWILKGVIYLEHNSRGSNFSVKSPPKQVGLTGNGKPSTLQLPERLELSGIVLPLCENDADRSNNIEISLFKVGESPSVRLCLESLCLGRLELNGSFSRTGRFWDIMSKAELSTDLPLYSLGLMPSWRQRKGQGKRIKINGFEEPLSLAEHKKYEHLSKDQVKITWHVPVHVEGQMVSMRLLLKIISDHDWTTSALKCSHFENSEGTIGKKIIHGKFMEIQLAPIALRSTDESSLFNNSVHSYTLENLAIGEYELWIVVEKFDGACTTNESTLPKCSIEEHSDFPPLTISGPPEPVVDLSAILQKTKTARVSSNEVFYEPFVVVSWRSPKLSLENMLNWKGPAERYIVGLEVFNVKQQDWHVFGEPIVVQRFSGKSPICKHSCTFDELPEVMQCGTVELVSKFRVSVQAASIFGLSDVIYSCDLDIPRFSINPTETIVDFCNIETSNCVICSENINFESSRKLEETLKWYRRKQTLKNFDPLLWDDYKTHSSLRGVVEVPEKLFNCPVSPMCCSHLFHLKCLLDWSRSSRERLTRMSGKVQKIAKCPLCMQKFRNVMSHVIDNNSQSDRVVVSIDVQIRKPHVQTVAMNTKKVRNVKQPSLLPLDEWQIVGENIVADLNF